MTIVAANNTDRISSSNDNSLNWIKRQDAKLGWVAELMDDNSQMLAFHVDSTLKFYTFNPESGEYDEVEAGSAAEKALADSLHDGSSDKRDGEKDVEACDESLQALVEHCIELQDQSKEEDQYLIIQGFNKDEQMMNLAIKFNTYKSSKSGRNEQRAQLQSFEMIQIGENRRFFPLKVGDFNNVAYKAANGRWSWTDGVANAVRALDKVQFENIKMEKLAFAKMVTYAS